MTTNKPAGTAESSGDFTALSDLTSPVVVVVDMVNGFAKEGALADPAIALKAAPIARIIEAVQADGGPIWFFNDAHSPDAREFETFAPHCLKGSKEAEVIEELAGYQSPQRTLEKNCISAFASPDIGRFLDSLPEDASIIVTGCCTDLCISGLALPLQSWMDQKEKKHMKVVVPSSCTATFHIEGVHDGQACHKQALDGMKSHGIVVVDDILTEEEKELEE